MPEGSRSPLGWLAHLLGCRDTDYDATIGPEPDALLSTEKETHQAHSAPPSPKRLLSNATGTRVPWAGGDGCGGRKAQGGAWPNPRSAP